MDNEDDIRQEISLITPGSSISFNERGDYIECNLHRNCDSKIVVSHVVKNKETVVGHRKFYIKDLSDFKLLKLCDKQKLEAKKIVKDDIPSAPGKTMKLDRGYYNKFNVKDKQLALANVVTDSDNILLQEAHTVKEGLDLSASRKTVKTLKMKHLPPWTNRLPFSYVLIDTYDQLNQAVAAIMQYKLISLGSQTVGIGREMTITILCVATEAAVYLFDIQTLPKAFSKSDLGIIMTTDKIVKVTFDCRILSDVLFNAYNVLLIKVFEIQAAFTLFDMSSNPRSNNTNFCYATSLEKLLKEKLNLTAQDYLCQYVREESEMKHNDRIWEQRPLNPTLKDGCVKKVAYLGVLRESLIDSMFNSLAMASEIYLGSLRDELPNLLYKNSSANRIPFHYNNLMSKSKEANERTTKLLRHLNVDHENSPLKHRSEPHMVVMGPYKISEDGGQFVEPSKPASSSTAPSSTAAPTNRRSSPVDGDPRQSRVDSSVGKQGMARVRETHSAGSAINKTRAQDLGQPRSHADNPRPHQMSSQNSGQFAQRGYMDNCRTRVDPYSHLDTTTSPVPAAVPAHVPAPAPEPVYLQQYHQQQQNVMAKQQQHPPPPPHPHPRPNIISSSSTPSFSANTHDDSFSNSQPSNMSHAQAPPPQQSANYYPPPWQRRANDNAQSVAPPVQLNSQPPDQYHNSHQQPHQPLHQPPQQQPHQQPHQPPYHHPHPNQHPHQHQQYPEDYASLIRRPPPPAHQQAIHRDSDTRARREGETTSLQSMDLAYKTYVQWNQANNINDGDRSGDGSVGGGGGREGGLGGGGGDGRGGGGGGLDYQQHHHDNRRMTPLGDEVERSANLDNVLRPTNHNQPISAIQYQTDSGLTGNYDAAPMHPPPMHPPPMHPPPMHPPPMHPPPMHPPPSTHYQPQQPHLQPSQPSQPYHQPQPQNYVLPSKAVLPPSVTKSQGNILRNDSPATLKPGGGGVFSSIMNDYHTVDDDDDESDFENSF